MNRSRILSALTFAVTFSPCLAQEATPAPQLETGVLLSAADLLPAALLKGPSHRVREQVPTDGYMAHFTIDTDFGVFTAIGVPQVKKRIVEAEAVGKLVATSKSDLFAEGIKRSIEQPIDAVKNIATHPVESVKAVPKTVGHFFGKVGRSIARGVDSASDRIRSDEPAPSAQEIGGGIGNAAKNVAGFDKAKLDTAKQLGVDPYSDNKRLQEEMEKVTWAFFAGGMPLRIGAAVASAGLAVTATNMVGIPEETYALTQSELTLLDEQALTKMGVKVADIEGFQRNPALSTTRRHAIVKSLEAFAGIGGRGNLILLANSTTTGQQADFLISAIQMLAEEQRTGAAKYNQLTVIGRLPGGITESGQLHVPAPVDYVTWTEGVAGFASRNDLGTSPKVLLHTGSLSPAAATGIAAAGWKTKAVSYPTR
jgi:hypothetical protein